ncbi:MAG TPA: hypothetical protein VN999_17305 [Thermoanaerobaculia bacterium]|nr:hypothetical protein [Thermoanaerobaculia bacterium]
MVKSRVPGEEGSSSGVSAPDGGDGAAPTTRAAVERARVILLHLIELSGLSRREVERRLLSLGRGMDLGRLLVSGKLDLKLGHILDILCVIEVYPLEFFRMVWERPRERSPLLARLEAIVLPTRMAARASGGQVRSEVETLERLLVRLEDATEEVAAVLAARRGAGAPRGEAGNVALRPHRADGPGRPDGRENPEGARPAPVAARRGAGDRGPADQESVRREENRG